MTESIKKTRANTKQLHAGVSQTHKGKSVWCTNLEGEYWCGLTGERTAQQLLIECETTIRDLLVNHPTLVSVYK